MGSDPEPRSRASRTEDEPKSPRVSDHAAENQKGLCLNCMNRETCLLPKNEGGVWHCEEYMEAS